MITIMERITSVCDTWYLVKKSFSPEELRIMYEKVFIVSLDLRYEYPRKIGYS